MKFKIIVGKCTLDLLELLIQGFYLLSKDSNFSGKRVLRLLDSKQKLVSTELNVTKTWNGTNNLGSYDSL